MNGDGVGAWVVVVMAAFSVAFSPFSSPPVPSHAVEASPVPALSSPAASGPTPKRSSESARPFASPFAKALWEAAEVGEPWSPDALGTTETASPEARIATWLRERGVTILPIVVSVPDPERGMALYSDQTIDALRHGATALKLSQRGFSLPATEEKGGGPGFIVFRGGETMAPILVVALLTKESPVLGPDRDSLRSALAVADALLEPGEPIAVLGPYFSGSAGSLAVELGAATFAWGRTAEIVTGSATAKDVGLRLAEEQFEHSFRRTILSDDVVIQHLRKRLADPRPQAPDRKDSAAPIWPQRVAEWFKNPSTFGDPPNVAILHEFDTVFGTKSGEDTEDTEDTEPQLIRVSFPSSIAQLRREKIREAPQGADGDPLSLRRTLELKVAPSEVQRPDTPLPLSDVTPFLQELELAEELRRLCRLRVDYLILSATDPLDILFLAEEVRAYCPRISLVLAGAEAIYRHPDLFSSLSGALVIGTYPLLFDAAEWSSASQSFAFGSHVTQGFYNAWVTLVSEAEQRSLSRAFEPPWIGFGPIGGARGCGDGDLVDESGAIVPPGKRKPIWMTKLRGGSFWPIDVECAAGSESVERTTPSFRSDEEIRVTGVARAIGFPILTAALLLLLAGIAASRDNWRFPLASLFLPPPPELESMQKRYAFGGRLAMSVLLVATLPSAFAVAQSVHGDVVRFAYKSGAILAALCAGGLAVSAWVDGLSLFRSLLGRKRENGHRDPWPRRWLVIPVLAFGLMLARFGLAYPLHLTQLGAIEEKMALYRTFEPLGMSPLLPITYLAAGFCLWSWLGLIRVRAMIRFTLEDPLLLRIPRRDKAPKDEDDEEQAAEATLSSQSTSLPTFTEVRWLLERALSGPLRLYEALALSVLFILGLYFITRVRPTWEGPAFDWLFRLGYAVLYGLVAICLVHFATLAALFSRFLRQIAALPMIEAYDRIAIKMTGSFGAQIGMRVPGFSELRVSRYSARLLASLARRASKADEEPNPYARVLGEAARELALCAEKVDAAFHDPELEPARGAQAAGHKALYETSQSLSRVLYKLWELRAEHPDTEAAMQAIDSKDLLIGGSRSGVPMVAFYQGAVPEEMLHWIRMAEDFVALRVATFASHVIFHLRALLSFAVGGALLLILAGSHYPFEPSRFVTVFGWGLAALVIFGGLTLIVRMERNEILSRIGGSRPGRIDLSLSFLARVLVYVGLPLLAVLTNSFPALRDALFAWVRPFAHFLP